MTKRSWFTIGVFILLLIAGIYYSRLGGFNDMEIGVADRPALYVTGQEYYGLTTDDELHSLIKEVHLSLRDSVLRGELMVCYFGNPDQDKNAIRVFVGAGAMQEPSDIPKGMKHILFPANKVVQAVINAYSFVAPNPDEVNAQLHEFASSKGMMLDTVYIERYASPQQIFNEIYQKQ